MAEFPALPLWTDAYLGDTTHLSTIEHGAYLLLLITAWRSRDCGLPDDDRILARYARASAVQWRKLRPILEPFFEIRDGKWTQGRLTDEAQAVRRRKDAAAQNGKRSALKRQGRHATEREPSESAASTESQPNGNLTNTNSKPPVSPRNEKAAKRPLPDDWAPVDFGEASQSRQIVDGWSSLEFERQLERFRAHHRKEGSRYADWQSAWSTWVLNSPGFAPRGGGSEFRGTSGPGSFVDQVLAEHSPPEAAR